MFLLSAKHLLNIWLVEIKGAFPWGDLDQDP